MNVQLNDSGVPIIRQKTFVQKVKGFLLWAILICLTLVAALLVYLCFAGASEMAGLTTMKNISDHPYYTMNYENFDYTDLLNQELPDNDAVIKYYKKKFFKGLSGFIPGKNENESVTKGSVAFFGRTFVSSYMKGRIYNSYDVPIMMITTKPANGYKAWNIIDMSDVGMQSGQNIDQWYGNAFQSVAAAYCTSEGINQEGLSVSLISCPVAECNDTSLANITPFVAVRLLLDRTATVDSAIELLKGYDIDFSSGAYHFFVSEKEFKSAIIEYVDGEMSVTYHTSGYFHQVCTNEMANTMLPPASRDFNDSYQEVTLNRYFDSSLAAQYKGGPGMSPSYAQLIMRDNSKNMEETNETHFGTNMYGTQYTVFYDMNRMTMQIVIENDTKNQSYTYDLTR